MNYFKVKKGVLSPRLGTLKLPHGVVKTPIFMPIATRGAVKFISPEDLRELDASIILSNTYHLLQRPGMDILSKHKGLHKFMGWDKPILTDSGGYQVFSLAHNRKITEEGVRFRSEVDGHEIFLTPESVIDTQFTIGSDIIMILDECPPWPCTYEYAKNSMEVSLRWAQRARNHFDKVVKKKRMTDATRPLIFGIVQGSTFKDLREQSARELVKMNFDGYAIGGVAVGEPFEEKLKVFGWVNDLLPADKPRYLMGLGTPHEIVKAVQSGVDMFDCVIPTREARHGRLYVKNKPVGTKDWYDVTSIKKEENKFDTKPISKKCSCYACRYASRSYLRHLFQIGEGLGSRLMTLHNLQFYLDMMRELRGEKLK